MNLTQRAIPEEKDRGHARLDNHGWIFDWYRDKNPLTFPDRRFPPGKEGYRYIPVGKREHDN